jgi:hypothetical protein
MAFSPFQYDWNAPFRQAAARPQAPQTGLTLADLWAPSPRPQYPDAPKPYGSYDELGEEAKKNLRREAILRAAMALGGDPGRIGSNLAQAASSVGDWKEGQLDDARQRQQQDYALASRQAEFEADREKYDREDVKRKTEAQGALQAVQAVIDAEPEWGARAEAAARAGDFDSLDKMLGEAEKRRQIRASGGDPDDPLWDDRAKSEMEEKRKREHEEWLREKGLGSYYDEPTDLSEIEAKSAAAARGQHSVWGDRNGGGPGGEGAVPRLLEHGDVPYQYSYDEATGTYTGRPVPGAPKPAPKWTKIEDPAKQETFFYDPTTGAVKPAPQGVNRTFDVLEEKHKRALTNEEKVVVEKQWRQGATPMLESDTVRFVEQSLGRRLTAEDRNLIRLKWKQGARAGLIVQQMKRPKPPAPGAPTQGNVRSPAPQRKQSAIPPPLRREAVSDKDRQDLRAEVDARFAALSPEKREEKYQAALRLLEQGA